METSGQAGFRPFEWMRGVSSGSEVPRFYDPMLAKLIVWAGNRDEAVDAMELALAGVSLQGIKSNLAFLEDIAGSNLFREGETTTAFLERFSHESNEIKEQSLDRIAIASLALDLTEMSGANEAAFQGANAVWYAVPGWRVSGQRLVQSYRINPRSGGSADQRDTTFQVEGIRRDRDRWSFTVNGADYSDVRFARFEDPAQGTSERLLLEFGSHTLSFEVIPSASSAAGGEGAVELRQGMGGWYRVSRAGAGLESASASTGAGSAAAAGTGSTVTAPMPGSIVKIDVAEGDEVQAHQPLAVMEAMKMEHVLTATHAGIVKRIHVEAGQIIPSGATVMEIEAA